MPGVAKFQSKEWGLSQSCRPKSPFVLFHGGLGDQLVQTTRILRSLKKISAQIQKRLQNPALDLVEIAVNELENDPIFNAGFGAKLQADGIPRLSSAIMDGKNQKMASISNVLSQRHPSSLARKLLNEHDRNLSSIEATLYALKNNFLPERVETKDRVNEWKSKLEGKTGTVGAVAFDSQKATAACTSTGGRGNETAGRMSDSYTPAGNFATPFGAVSCTGVGEEILDAAVAAAILTRLEDGFSLSEAVSKSCERHREKRFGLIGIDHRGHAIVYATRGAMAFGLVTADQIQVGLLPEDWALICDRNETKLSLRRLLG